MADTEVEAEADADAEMFEKVAKFSKYAYKKLRPAMDRLEYYTGPHTQ